MRVPRWWGSRASSRPGPGPTRSSSSPPPGGPLVVSWPAAGRAHVEAANRAIHTGLAVPPQPTAGASEAAYPVRSAGAVIGAVACRWIGPPLVDPSRAGPLLSAVAAAVAPGLRVLLDYADAPALPGIESELLGVSGAMEEVRRAVARAADAPYPVLVQAESGAGKELVARAIHRASARRTRPFCALELRGAARRTDRGRAVRAHQGRVHRRGG